MGHSWVLLVPCKHTHTHKQTNTQVLVSEWHGSTWCGVSLGSSISTPRKTSMALFDPPLKVCLKRAMDEWRDGGDTPDQWAWPAASGTFSPHSYHPIKSGTQRQRRRDWSKRRGRWGDSTPSLWRAELMRKPTQTHTHTQLTNRFMAKRFLNGPLYLCSWINSTITVLEGCYTVPLPHESKFEIHLNPETSSESLIIWW